MTPLAPLTLAGRHVRLEPLAVEHAAALLRAASGSRATYALTLVPRDEVEMRAYIDAALEEQRQGAGLPFVVRDAAGDVVGSTRFTSVETWRWPGEPPPPVPGGPDVVEIGFTWYAERAQRTALNTEAKLLLCTHAFEVWGVRRVMWKTDARNERSRAAILRLGAKFDGVLRAHRPAADGRSVRDTAFFSMLREEWPEAKRALEARLGGAPRPPRQATTRDAITTDRVARPAGPFSPAVRGRDQLYLSGQIGQDPRTGALVSDDVEAQAEQIFRNLAAVLEAAGRSLADVLRVGMYLTDMRDFARVNAIYARHFDAPYPARTAIGVATLPLGASIEIDLVAR